MLNRSIYTHVRFALFVGVLLLMIFGVSVISAEPWPEDYTQWRSQLSQPQTPAETTSTPSQTPTQQNTQWNSGTTTQSSEWNAGTTDQASNWSGGDGVTIVNVHNDVAQHSAKRLGLNIGRYDQYGASQILNNVVPNPGFESAEFAMLFLVGPGATANRVQPNAWSPPWNAHQNGFWNGAQFEIIGGPAKGTTGRISNFAVEGGKYTFYLEGNWNVPNLRDPIIVRQQIPGYWSETPTNHQEPAPGVARPGSPGTQSLMLRPSGWDPSFYVPFDSFGRDGDTTAKKMRIIEGRWHFEFWAKAQHQGQTMEVKFHRVRECVFFSKTIQIPTSWQKIEQRFDIGDATVGDGCLDNPHGTPSPVAFEMRIASGNGNVWIDDMEVSEFGNSNPTAFADNFVNMLKNELRPGVIRNWGHQLGTTLDNQISHQWARKTNEYDPHVADPHKFHYSLHEFLQLAQHINAEPWYVVPPTWSSAELSNLIAYLSAPVNSSHPYAQKRAALGQSEPWTNVFTKIHLEFGNEMWGGNTSGDPFRGATFWDGYQVGQIGGERLGIMRHAPYFNPGKINLFLGGQAGFAPRQAEIESKSYNHTGIGVAPYFASHMDVYNNQSNMFYPMFANPLANTQAGGKMSDSRSYIDPSRELAIYEIHTHLTTGNMPIAQRNDFVTSLGVGIAMPLHMLTYQRDLGVRTQSAFTALQYSFMIPGRGGERVRLWGMLIDSEASQMKRPTWMGLEIANRAIKGDMLVTEQTGANPTWTQQPINGIASQMTVPYVQSFAFRQWNNYSLVLFNLNLYESETVQLQLPSTPNSQATLHTMTGNSIMADNENGVQQVFLNTESMWLSQGQTIELPPHSIYVIEWTGN